MALLGCLLAILTVASASTDNTFLEAVRRETQAEPTTADTLPRRAAAMFAWQRAHQHRGVDLSSYEAALAGANVDAPNPADVDAGLAALEALAGDVPLLEEVRGEPLPAGPDAEWTTILADAAHTGSTRARGGGVGEIAWALPLGSRWRAGPVVRDGVVYAASPGTMTTAYAINEETGAVRWRALRYATNLYGELRGEGPVRLAGGRLVVPLKSGDGRLAALQHLDPATGRVLEQRPPGLAETTFQLAPLPEGVDLVAHLTPRANPNAGQAVHRQEVVLREAVSGRTWWTFPVGEGVGEPVLDGDAVYVAATGGVWKLHRDGPQRVAWFVPTDSPPIDSPTLAGGRVLVPLREGVLALSPEGEELWHRDLGPAARGDSAVRVADLVAGDNMIFALIDSKVMKLHPAGGDQVWEATAREGALTHLALRDEALYLVDLQGQLSRWTTGDDIDGLRQWTTPVSDFPILAPPIVGEHGILVQPADGSLVSVGFDGQIRWRHRLMETATVAGEEVLADVVPGQFQSSPVVADGRVTIGTPAGHVVSADADTGKVRWRVDVGGKVSGTPTFGNGAHFVGQYGGDEHFTAINADGTVRWRAPIGWCWATPVYEAGTVYAATTAGDVVALDARTGERRWTFRAAEGCYTPPTLGPAAVYAGSWDGHYYALDKETGRVIWARRQPGWAYAFGGKPDSAMPTLADGRLFVQLLGGRVQAIDAQTGRDLWESTWTAGRANNGGTAVQGDLLLASTFRSVMAAPLDARLVGLDAATGRERWTLDAAGGLTGPVVGGGLLYAASTTEAAVACYDLADAPALRWRVRLGGVVEESVPAAAGGRTYVVASDGRLYAIR